ncbi:MAG: glycosyltransferase [Oenococcus sp.]|uniref:glycosyltransferase family 4 protein n=1 Tax=Oenococcus sp. TaxID=1979414 RepID=UPI0039ECEE3E
MIFFINANMQKNKSGIEHAELKRADLFRHHQTAFKVLLRDWSPTLHQDLADSSLSDDEVINLFDYFQGTEKVNGQVVSPRSVDLGCSVDFYEDDPANNRLLAFQRVPDIQGGAAKQKLLARINYFADSKPRRVRSTELFDAFGNLYAVDFYDTRGFVSMTQWYSPDNKIANEAWQTLDGRPVIEAFHKFNAIGEQSLSSWRLCDPDGSIRIFDNLDQLYKHFLDLINAAYFSQKEANIFILDRSDLGDWALTELKQPAYTALHLHNSQAVNPNDEQHALLNNHYEYSLWQANSYDAIISATAKQSHDIQARFKPQVPCFTIPVGVIPDAHFQSQTIKMAQRQPHSVIALARIAPEKQLDQLVKAIAIAQKQVPDITLDLYGYRDASNNYEAYREIVAVIKENQLEKQVHVHEYTTRGNQIEQQAQVFAVTSAMEGFNLSLMEGLAQGDVGLTYDVNYGPNELVVDGKNGCILPYGDYQALAEKLVWLFQNPDQLQRMSDQAYRLSQRYSEKQVWQAWSALFDDAKRSWPAKLTVYRPAVTDGLGEQGEKI